MTYAVDRALYHKTVVQSRRYGPWHWAKGWNAYQGTRTACEVYFADTPVEVHVPAAALTEHVTCKRCLRAIAEGTK